MSESDFSALFCKLTKSLDPVRIENSLTYDKTVIGVPDINFIPGWAELKWKKGYPKRKDTPVRIEHYTQNQKDWLARRAEAGGNAWLVLRVRSHIYVFDAHGAQNVGDLTKDQLLEACIAFFPKTPKPEEFCRVFTGLP